MSDWADFCGYFEINPNDPEEFDRLINSEIDEKVLVNKKTGVRYSFADLAEKSCSRCSGTGYIGKFKWNCGGRCFKCIPDYIWNEMEHK